MSKPFPNSAADILAQVMINLGLGIAPSDPDTGDWPVRPDSEVNTPDRVLTVYDTTAQEDGRAMVDGERFRHYGCQIRVRSQSQPEGWQKAEIIHRTLSEGVYQMLVNVPLQPSGSANYIVNNVSCKMPLRLGRDAPTSNRHLHTINCIVSITPQ